MIFSIVIPVRNDPENLTLCLRSLRNEDLNDCEILVADDGSEPPLTADQLPATRASCRVLRLPPRGPAAARNAAADEATGEYLFFLDADAQPQPGMLQRARSVIAESPDIVSFFGSYDDAPAWPSLVSVYRNLLHHHVHQSAAAQDVSTFWCGCGVVKRTIYLDCGGLSESFDTPSIEDVAFGLRLNDRGISTRIVPDLQVKHLKRWTVGGWLRTDLFQRGIPWVRLMRARGEWVSELNATRSQRAAAAAALASVVLLIGAWWWPWAALVAAAAMALFVFVNRGLFRLIARQQGIVRAVGTVPLHLLYALVCVASVVVGYCSSPLTLEYRKRGESDAGASRGTPHPAAAGHGRSALRSLF
jgi:GT2 family glycosyltransferase